MRENRKDGFHRLLGAHKPRINYRKSDFIDFLLMQLLCAAAISLAYGADPWLATLGTGLCACMIFSFSVRHGVGFKLPLPLRRTPFSNPLFAALAYTREMRDDIHFHQFIPGVFSTLGLDLRWLAQHFAHHLREDCKYLPEVFRNSVRLDEELNGFVKICEEHE